MYLPCSSQAKHRLSLQSPTAFGIYSLVYKIKRTKYLKYPLHYQADFFLCYKIPIYMEREKETMQLYLHSYHLYRAIMGTGLHKSILIICKLKTTSPMKCIIFLTIVRRTIE